MCCCLMYEIKVGEWPLSNRSCVLLFLSTALVLRPAANSRECLLESKNERICSTNCPTKSTGTNKINLGNPVDFVPHPYHHYIICSTSYHFPLCPVVFRSSVRRGKRRYGERMGNGRILTAYRGANLRTTQQ